MRLMHVGLGLVLGSVVLVPSTAQASDPIMCGVQEATIVGTEGPDVIVGTPGEDVIVSLGGDDQISGIDGDTVCAGAGDDRVVGIGRTFIVYSGDGNDWMESSGRDGDSSFFGEDGDDVLISEGNSYFFGGEGDDRMVGGPLYDQFTPGPGRDTIEGRGGPDQLLYDTASGPVFVDVRRGVARGEGRDTFTGVVNVIGSAFSDRIVGDDGPNSLLGDRNSDEGSATDRIRGRGGDDKLGGVGNMFGGTGDDSLNFGEVEGTNDHYDGGPGTDSSDYSGRLGPITVNLPEGTATGPHIGRDTLLNIEQIDATQYADTLIGDDADNVFYGRESDDHIEGGGGDDRIDGGYGNDDLDGGLGIDKVDGGNDIDTCMAETVVNCERRPGEP